MSYEITGRRAPTKPKKQARAQKRKRDDVDVEKLEQAVVALVSLHEFFCICQITRLMRAVGHHCDVYKVHRPPSLRTN